MQTIKSRVRGLNIKHFVRRLHNLNPKNSSKQNDIQQIVLEPLKRDLIAVQGIDAKSFLQGLITNDMLHLDGRADFGCIYTLFLNSHGRILYDSIIYRLPQPNSYLVECDHQISTDLHRYLRQFRVRRKVDIEMDTNFQLWVAFSPTHDVQLKNINIESSISIDPRIPALGVRIFANKDENLESLSKRFVNANIIPSDGNINYRMYRYQIGIGEGVEELPPGKSFPLESNADYLHGISFHKGCYIGQELTARTYHTGVIRKRLMPLLLEKPIDRANDEILTQSGNKVGLLRGLTGNYGLGLVYVNKVLNGSPVLTNGETCTISRPIWWPQLVADQRKTGVE